MTPLVRVLTGAAIAVAGAYVGIGVVIARRVVLPRPKRRVTVTSADPDAITLPADAATTAPGIHRAYFGPNGEANVLLGQAAPVPDTDTVRRPILGGRTPMAGDGLILTGYVPDRPTDLGSPFEDITYSSRTGHAAWYFPGDHTDLWTIHVHGMHSERRAVLRGLPPVLDEGLPALVLTYSGDHESSGPERVTLGQDEAHDVDDAISYALAHGAQRVVLFGWSMGATAAVFAASHGTHTSAIAGIVTVCPVFDWQQTITAGVRAAHLPAILSSAGVLVLTAPLLHWLGGLPRALDRQRLRPELPADLPMLVIYSRGDEQAPPATTEALAAQSDAVTLVRFQNVPHGFELNSDPDGYLARVRQFLRLFI
ncbi:alpha/beta hydrolase family protein [Curtobacterium sp. Leaf261]|uniref:alpha/beta hydrolase family protein n=1 Tax=Curtobacterium sp. Leaf261 TaxID=1736311 RepID=UPI000714C9CD|nr:alpha/beta fold hydrolase [Curtobacterium sp. Leaf261]KQO64268.1 hypothetical protein ASF23_17040 [Curtobacterium sp. Leaf261]